MTDQEKAREWANDLKVNGPRWLGRDDTDQLAALLDRLAEGGAVKPVQQPHACPVCGGSGQVFDRYAAATSATVACSPCQGTGILWR